MNELLSSHEIAEPARKIPVYGEFDVVVLGGGPAGIAAAASAAKNGLRVLLVERYGFLGGMGTAGGVTNFCGLYANVYGEIRQVVHGVADDILGRMRDLGGLNTPHLIFGKVYAQSYDMSAFKCAADAVLEAAGVQILFHALGAGISRSGDGDIEALILETKSGRVAVRASVFIDCSGDADLAQWAGVGFEKGTQAGEMLYPSLMFRVGGVNPEATGEAWLTIPKVMKEVQESGKYRFSRSGAIVRPQKNPAEWRANVTQLSDSEGRATDGTDARALSAGELEGRRQITEYIKFLKQEIVGFEDAYVLDIAPQVGIRETRRIVGEYMLTGDDVLSCASFDDSIGVNGWPLEKHVAGDVVWEWPAIPETRGYNQLPYRMLVPRDAEQTARNLLVAGRCASMTHDGQSAARVTGGCFVMGEAAGVAAALALRGNTDLSKVDTRALQRILRDQGAFLGDD
ncbi:FAD-dependent oxidoreductase [Paraburkholderia diazotrophica]|uniref:FAD dependent oxidoreductase n=1 Tax=Paraburkholderia diazotrophica TaxID=667676 RepID=A0A1H7CYR4_9BURK|nr:FAD-dependent oxidoreductase [Paraburkholderia diazotrophica]SEJ91890.1 FAD dependent oxidoreductase [Paraburkholderia diazotrophica]